MPTNQFGLAGSAQRSPCGMRRSSAAGITHHRPPLPPSTIGKRSQSLDGLLDTANNKCTTIDNINTEGASDDTPNTLTTTDSHTHTSYDTTDSINQTSTNHRRSRSLEDLLDERDEIHSNYDSHSKSVDSSIDTLSMTTEPSTELVKDDETGDKADTSSIGSASSLNPSQTEKPCSCETITVQNTVPQSNETDSSVAAARPVDDDRVSNLTAYSRQGSTTSKDSDNKKKTFLNRYVKKVKSFIKK
ncbi:papilin-like [Bradysia coprophila]|uniref:papilin-like n=1 Tax=Bradysia coprophila TaxID=38358 RepID=UPI00187D7282|nr:papilin-like [Bradysia coprophila]